MSRLRPHSPITVVDDDPVSLDFLVLHLASAGHEAIVARDGGDVLEILQSGRSRIVISDWLMPGMDGAEICSAVRGLKGLDYIYFIMLTMMTEKTRLVEAFKAGVDDFITKPFCEGELLARLRAGIRMLDIQDKLMQESRLRSQLNDQLGAANEKLARLVVTDELTNLPNRRYAMMRIAEEWSLANRQKQPLSCAVVDVDRFKCINDMYGHSAGDEVLRQVAQLLRASVRDCDTVCRIGGDEFLILFHGKDAQAALPAAERCRLAIQSLHAEYTESKTTEDRKLSIAGNTILPPILVTVSIGIAQKKPEMTVYHELLQDADEALYAAKADGRNSARAAGFAPCPVASTGPSETEPPLDTQSTLRP